MFSILIKTEDHTKITSTSRKYLPYSITYNEAEVRDGMRRTYQQLYNETGDKLYLFLRDFSSVASPY